MLVEAKGEAGFVKDYLKHKIEESYGSLKRKAAKAIQAALKDQQNRGLCISIYKIPIYAKELLIQVTNFFWSVFEKSFDNDWWFVFEIIQFCVYNRGSYLQPVNDISK